MPATFSSSSSLFAFVSFFNLSFLRVMDKNASTSKKRMIEKVISQSKILCHSQKTIDVILFFLCLFVEFFSHNIWQHLMIQRAKKQFKRINFKLLITWKALNNQAPSYISRLLQLHTSIRSLPSDKFLLTTPKTSTFQLQHQNYGSLHSATQSTHSRQGWRLFWYKSAYNLKQFNSTPFSALEYYVLLLFIIIKRFKESE